MTDSIALAEEFTPYLAPLFQRKAISITAIDIHKMTSYASLLVIVEAGSRRQTTSLAEHIIKSLKARKVKIRGMEGIKEGEWALVDCGHIIFHIFESETRQFYDLEGLWSDAPRVDLSSLGPLPERDTDDDDF